MSDATIREIVAEIRGQLDRIEEHLADPALAERLLGVVTGREPPPGSQYSAPRSPGSSAMSVAAAALGKSGWSMDDPEVEDKAREIMDAAGYWPGYAIRDGRFHRAEVFSFRTPTGLAGFTPERAVSMIEDLRAHFKRYGSRLPYPFALEMDHYGIDPREVYPYQISEYVSDAFDRATR